MKFLIIFMVDRNWERQSAKMKIKYLEAASRQDIQYFDTQVRTSYIVFAINIDVALV